MAMHPSFHSLFRPVAFSIMLAITATWFTSCQNDDAPQLLALGDGLLVSSEWQAGYTAADVQSTLKIIHALVGEDILDEQVLEYDIDVYRLVYKTIYKGGIVNASGLIAIPKNGNGMPILSFQHGTIASDSEAPSVSPENPINIGITSIASAGYYVLFPDWIGFGESADIDHPYMHAETTIQASMDFLTASREFLASESKTDNGKIFLAGYSQGGWASMLLHHEVEEAQAELGLELVATACGAGPFDLLHTQSVIIEQGTYTNPFFLPYIFISYQSVGQLDIPLSQVFKEPYAAAIPGLFDGINTGGQINAQLTQDMSLFMTDPYRLENGSGDLFPTVRDALVTNSAAPKPTDVMIKFYHSPVDEAVPYTNSVRMREAMLNLGVSSGNAEIVDLEGGLSHSDGSYHMILHTLKWFESLQ